MLFKNTSNLSTRLSSLKLLIKKNETESTYEKINATLSFPEFNVDIFKTLKRNDVAQFNLNNAAFIAMHAFLGNSKKQIGVYQLDKYVPAYNQLKEIWKQIGSNEKPIDSRQFIIEFEKLHCFQTIQFLFRNRKLIVIANMRSCNFEVNLLTDLFLLYHMGYLTFLESCSNYNLDIIDAIDIKMNIGSLHIFKEKPNVV